MKKALKTCLVTGVGCIAAGVVLYGAGSLTGGKTYVRAADLNRLSTSAMKNENSSAVLAKTQIDDYHNLEINLNILDLKVIPSEDEHFYISYNVNTDKQNSALTYTVGNDTLTLKETNSSTGSFVHVDIGFLADLFHDKDTPDSENSITLYVPEDTVLKKLNLNSDMSEIQIASVNADSGSIRTESGDIELKSCDLNNVTLNSDMGDITIKKSNLDTCTLTSKSGDFECTNVTFSGDTSITSDMGEVDIEGPTDNLTKLAIQVNTNIGDIHASDTLDGYFKKNDEDYTQTFLKDVEKPVGNLTIQTDSGDVSLKCK